jgi:hypothetical protein
MKTDEHTGTHDELYTFAIYRLGSLEASIRTGYLRDKIEATDDSPRKNNADRIADNIDAVTRTLIYHKDCPEYMLHELEVIAFDVLERTGNQQIEELAAHLRHALLPDHEDAPHAWSQSSYENPNE